MLRILTGAAALAAAFAAHAGDVDHRFRYGFLEASYEHQDPTATDDAENGFSVGGSLDLSDHFFLDLDYSSLYTPTFSDGTTEGKLQHRTVDATLGGDVPLGDYFGVTATAGYAWADTRGLGGFAQDPLERHVGPTGSLALRVSPFRRLDLSAGSGYSYISREPGWDRFATLTLQASDRFWIDGGYWVGQDQTAGWSVTLRTMIGRGD